MTDLRIVIVALAVTLLVALMWIGFLASRGQTAPDVLENVTIGALTALAGVLTGRAGARRQQRV